MKIAVVRGDFASPWELQNFAPIVCKHEVAIFTGKRTIFDLNRLSGFDVVKLHSPVDINFGKISRIRMAILNRIFVDAHVLFGLENALAGFDIAHCAETYFSFTQQCIRAKRQGKVRVVVSTVWENIPFNNEGIAGRKEFKKNAFSEIDLFLPTTEIAKDVLLEEGCNENKILVLRPGVDLNLFYRRNVRINIKNKTKILFVGRLEKEKGILELLDVFKQLTGKYKNLQLIIVGNGSLREEIEERVVVNRLKNVTLMGPVPYGKMPFIYRNSDIFVHLPIGSTTWSEQFGMVLVEAMASGLPIVALRRGSVDEVIGEGGVLVKDVAEFASELETVVRSARRRRELQNMATRMARQNYDSVKVSQRLVSIYKELLDGKKT